MPKIAIYDLEARNDPSIKQPKTLFAGDQFDGQAVLVVEQDDISVFADQTKGISVSEEFGVTIAGPVRFATTPDQMSFGGGYWRLDPRHLSTIPSTTPTPVPLLVKATPDILKGSSDISDVVGYLELFSNIGVI